MEEEEKEEARLKTFMLSFCGATMNLWLIPLVGFVVAVAVHAAAKIPFWFNGLFTKTGNAPSVSSFFFFGLCFCVTGTLIDFVIVVPTSFPRL